MKSSDRPLLLGAALAFFFTLTLAAFAQEQPAPPPAAAPNSESAPAVAPAAPEAEKPVAVEKSTLRRIDADAADAVAPDPVQPTKGGKNKRPAHRKNHEGNEYVRFASDIQIESGETVDGDVVGILGNVTIDGAAKSDVTSIMGDTTINGTVAGDVVAVMGDVTLGPKAVVEGDITTVRGTLHRDPGAVVHGRITQQSMGGKNRAPASMQAWWDRALSHGALLGFGRGLGWLTLLSLLALGFYALMALVFPGGIRRTGDMLVQRPAAVVFSALLTMIALPVLFILLCVTVIGIPVALLVLPVSVVLAIAFGKAAIYGLVGRSATGDKFPAAVSVLIGGLIFMLLYLAPVLGLALSLLVAVVGLGCAVTALLSSGKKPAPPAARIDPAIPPVVVAAAMPVSDASAGFAAPAAGLAAGVPLVSIPVVENTSSVPQSAGFGAADSITPPFVPLTPPGFAPVAEALPPGLPGTPNATLPRAGFWIRTGAALIDLVLVAVIFGPAGAGALILPGLAAYGATMWKFKGTTIGGIVCGLRVVRLDDRVIDWPTAVVRALGCFLSLVVAGLGFVWVVFDSERQSWHDKIAGTVVVRSPKGVSLV